MIKKYSKAPLVNVLNKEGTKKTPQQLDWLVVFIINTDH